MKKKLTILILCFMGAAAIAGANCGLCVSIGGPGPCNTGCPNKPVNEPKAAREGCEKGEVGNDKGECVPDTHDHDHSGVK